MRISRLLLSSRSDAGHTGHVVRSVQRVCHDRSACTGRVLPAYLSAERLFVDTRLLGLWYEGYYWVPGTWVEPPAEGLLWTPGYWGWGNGAYVWNAGYWGPTVGFYGGIDYGFGYVVSVIRRTLE